MDNLISKRVETWRRRRGNGNDNENVNLNLNENGESLLEFETARTVDDDDQETSGHTVVRGTQSAWPQVVLMDVTILSDNMADEEETVDDAYDQALRAVRDDEELTAYVHAIRDIGELDAICAHLHKNKNAIYNLTKRLKRRLKKQK